MPQQTNQKELYQRMLDFFKSAVQGTEDGIALKLNYLLDTVREQAYALNEYTREEVDKVAEYLQRDLVDGTEYLSEEGRELKHWLKFDVELIEERLLDVLSQAINTTNIELEQLQQAADREKLWYRDEIASPGSFICVNCQHHLGLYKIQELPACPNCGEGVFRRVSA